MTEIVERSEVERVLVDPASRVPEAAPATGGSAFGEFRAGASRFVNGRTHRARRDRLGALLDALDPERLSRAAAERAAALVAPSRARGEEGVTTYQEAREACIRHVPVAVLAEALGFGSADALPSLVATVAEAYPTGEPDDPVAADASVTALLAASPSPSSRPSDRILEVQLLVQASVATATLIERALVLADSGDAASASTRRLLEAVLRDDSPVPFTRRVVRTASDDGDELARLRLDGPDHDAAAADRPARNLAFGAGPRACPAPHQALAIASAVVEAVRAGVRPAAEGGIASC